MPLDGSDAGVAKFQAAHEALRKKVRAAARPARRSFATHSTTPGHTRPARFTRGSRVASAHTAFQVGVLSPDERLAAAVAAARSASPSVRAFLASAAELRAGADLPDTLGADGALNAALDAVEKAAGGAPLLFSDAKGMASFKAAAKEFAAKAGLAGVTSASLLPASAKEQAAAAVAAIKAAHDQALASAKQSAEL